MWDLSSLNRDWTHTPWVEVWSLNNWTSRAVLILQYFSPYLSRQCVDCLILWQQCHNFSFFFLPFYFLFFFISWRLITLQYCSGFCHTLTRISHGFTRVPHPDPPSHLPLHPIPLGLPSAPGPSTSLMHPTWAGDLFHPRQYTCFDAVLLKHPTLAFSHRVEKSVLYIIIFL